ncbi:hypothetical protein [Kribbella sp. CA-294648]
MPPRGRLTVVGDAVVANLSLGRLEQQNLSEHEKLSREVLG